MPQDEKKKKKKKKEDALAQNLARMFEQARGQGKKVSAEDAMKMKKALSGRRNKVRR